MPEPQIPWPHAPTHQLGSAGTYFVTAGTYTKQHYFCGSERLAVLHRGLLTVAARFGWRLEAWAVFSNHYHFVAQSPEGEPDASTLAPMLKSLHVKLAGWVNRLDGTPGRQVWFNYRETKLTYQRSYLARLNYVHQNAVKHGLVRVATRYPWCSARWLERECSPSIVKSLSRFDPEKVKVPDEFEASADW